MIKVIGVRFKKAGKIYYFDPSGLDVKKDMDVIVETSRGVEFGKAAMIDIEVTDDKIPQDLKSVIRIATEKDIRDNKKNKDDAVHAMSICSEKAAKHDLDMKLINSEYTFLRSKLIFYFTADGRVDFRNLVRDLASIFKTRIELRQVGVRDEAKMLNGIGICGRPICCANWKYNFESISIKNAKDQSLSLNPSKISGVCGRLMCCINYEHSTYVELLKNIPQHGSTVETPDGKGIIIKTNTLKQNVKVRLVVENNKLSDEVYEFGVEEIKKVDSGKKPKQKQK